MEMLRFAARWQDGGILVVFALRCLRAFLQGVSIALLSKPCTSCDRQAVCRSVCLSVCHTLALSENDAS